jgi:hypothetical protein
VILKLSEKKSSLFRGLWVMLNVPFNNISVTSRSSVWIWGGGRGRKYRNKTNTIPSITNKLFRYRDIEIPHVMASRVTTTIVHFVYDL